MKSLDSTIDSTKHSYNNKYAEKQVKPLQPPIQSLDPDRQLKVTQQPTQMLKQRAYNKKWVVTSQEQKELETIQNNYVTNQNLLNSLYSPDNQQQLLENLKSHIDDILKQDPEDPVFGKTEFDENPIIDKQNIQINELSNDAQEIELELNTLDDLEMFNIAFDGYLQQLLEQKTSVDKIVPALKEIKNYYVTKISKKSQYQKASEEATNKMDKMVQDLLQEAAVRNKYVAELEQTCSKAQSDLEYAKTFQEKYELTTIKLAGELSVVQAQYDNLRRATVTTLQELSRVKQQLADTQTRLTRMSSLLQRSNKQLKILSQQKEEIEQNILTLSSDKQSLTFKIKQQEKHIFDLQEKCGDLRHELDDNRKEQQLKQKEQETRPVEVEIDDQLKGAIDALLKFSTDEYQDELQKEFSMDKMQMKQVRLLMQKLQMAQNSEELAKILNPEKKMITVKTVEVQTIEDSYLHNLMLRKNEDAMRIQTVGMNAHYAMGLMNQQNLNGQVSTTPSQPLSFAVPYENKLMMNEFSSLYYQCNFDAINVLFGSSSNDINLEKLKFYAGQSEYGLLKLIDILSTINNLLCKIPPSEKGSLKRDICEQAANKNLVKFQLTIHKAYQDSIQNKMSPPQIKRMLNDLVKNMRKHQEIDDDIMDNFNQILFSESGNVNVRLPQNEPNNPMNFKMDLEKRKQQIKKIQDLKFLKSQESSDMKSGKSSINDFTVRQISDEHGLGSKLPGIKEDSTQMMNASNVSSSDEQIKMLASTTSLLMSNKPKKLNFKVKPEENVQEVRSRSIMPQKTPFEDDNKSKDRAKSLQKQMPQITKPPIAQKSNQKPSSKQNNLKSVKNSSQLKNQSQIEQVARSRLQSAKPKVEQVDSTIQTQGATVQYAHVKYLEMPHDNSVIEQLQKDIEREILLEQQRDQVFGIINSDAFETKKVDKVVQTSSIGVQDQYIQTMETLDDIIDDNGVAKDVLKLFDTTNLQNFDPRAATEQVHKKLLNTTNFEEGLRSILLTDKQVEQKTQFMLKDFASSRPNHLVKSPNTETEEKTVNIFKEQLAHSERVSFDLEPKSIIDNRISVISQTSSYPTKKKTIEEPKTKNNNSIELASPLQKQQLSQLAVPNTSLEIHQLKKLMQPKPLDKDFKVSTTVTSNGKYVPRAQKIDADDATVLVQIYEEKRSQLETKELKINLLNLKKIMTEVQNSFLEQHPHAGTFLEIQSNLEVLPVMSQFVLVHFKDRLFMKYQPLDSESTIDGSTRLAPCIIGDFHLKDFKRLQNNTLTDFNIKSGNVKKKQEEENVELDILIPKMVQQITRVRLNSLAQTQSEPNMFKLMHKYFKFVPKYTKFNNEIYIEMPYKNITRRSLPWTLRLARQILNMRTQMNCSFVKQIEIEGALLTVQKEADFEVFKRQLQRQEYESLSGFTCWFIHNKYGQNSVCVQLMLSFLANLAYYQYEDSELYLFTRFLFDDLDNEFFQTFIELRRILKLHEQEPTALEFIHIDVLEDLNKQVFQNWEPSRHILFIQQIFAVLYSKMQQGESKPSFAIEFSELAGLILFSLSTFRRQVYNQCTLTYQYLLKEANVEYLSMGGFRQFLQILLPEWNSQTVNEAFYVFNIDGKITTDSISKLFRSMQLSRFVKLQTDLLNKVTSLQLKKQTANMSQLYQQMQQVVQRMVTHLEANNAEAAIHSVKMLNQQIQQDIFVYDVAKAVINCGKLLSAFVSATVEAKAELGIVTIGGSISALKTFLKIVK
ncbi:Conserved_hypothetical protein [Hexamita inflata]|uniref:Uncharacterized protein n=1 Tax=Hexamita inflata TaxID=28002 RepID=A0AA86QNE8_9EUKA|nr:Conserved hypothetical protein [Hexamita inflata]